MYLGAIPEYIRREVEPEDRTKFGSAKFAVDDANGRGLFGRKVKALSLPNTVLHTRSSLLPVIHPPGRL